MNHQIFAWGSSRNKLRQEENWIDFLCLMGLLLAALVIFGVNLASVPLTPGIETTIAHLAQEVGQKFPHESSWLFPSLSASP